jgi:hypothetical protein
MKKSLLKALTVMAALTVSSASWATFVSSTSTDAIPTGALSSDLQGLLNSVTQDGEFYGPTYVYNEANQVVPDQQWTLASSGSGTAILMFEIAGNANSNTFGVYDLNNTGNTLQLFSGAASPVTKVALNLDFNTGELVVVNETSPSNPIVLGTATFSSGDNFGFYLGTSAGTFYSEVSLNADLSDHMVAYAGDGTENIDPTGGTRYNPFAAGEFILAWEDLAASSWDQDYNDMVILVESITPIPEPSVIALLGLGLLGMGFAHSRKSS